VVRLDKEPGITSHDAVDRLRRIVGTRRVGHAGTLDPFASGLLLLAWGRATRLLPFLAGSAKTYRGLLTLGVVTDTGDRTGTVVETSDAPIDEARVRNEALAFVGLIAQRAPAYSAIKQGGEALYKKARRGDAIEPPVRPITIHALDVRAVDVAARTVEFDLTCSSGTYVRSLAVDWGRALGTGGSLAELRRLAIGPHDVTGAIPTPELIERPGGSIPEWNERLTEAGLTPEQALAFLPHLALTAEEATALADGRAPLRRRALDAGLAPGTGAIVLADPSGALVAVAGLAGDAAEAPDVPLALRMVWAAREEAAR
jgi:tRNA pseudouridine55 synthase